MSCYSLQREKVRKIKKIPEYHKNVRFGSDLPTNSSLPSKTLFISLPTSPSKMKRPDFQKHSAAGSSLWDPFSYVLRPRSKTSCSPFCALAGGRTFDRFIKTPKSVWDSPASLPLATTVGGHSWSPPVLPGRLAQRLSSALQLLHDGQSDTGWFLWGEKQEPRFFNSRGERNRSFLRRSKERRGGHWLPARGELLLPLHCNSCLVFETYHTISSITRGKGLG